ncbi:MAG: DUF3857 domain-containing protein [Saprospiraceae bacterium]|nr:DUF3857 domain-containing protein [Saprospiraceae bacterium]
MKNWWIIFVLFCSVSDLCSQEYFNPVFGDVSISDFKQTSYDIDPEAGAVVLFDKGYTEVVTNRKEGFDQKVTRHKRIHILKNSGFDAAEMEIILLKNENYEDKLKSLEAVTYSLEGDQIVTKKLDKKSVFKRKKNGYQSAMVFSLPNVKENTIIEISYTYVSFLQNLFQPWSFQNRYPVLWSEYKIKIPSFIVFTYTLKGYRKCDIDTSEIERTRYILGSNGAALNISDLSVTKRWVMKNVPPFKEEKYLSAASNYQPALTFQFMEVKEPFEPYTMVSSWEEFREKMMSDKYFGRAIEDTPKFGNDILKKLAIDQKKDLEKVKSIYHFVRDSISGNGDQNLFVETTLENVFFWRSGEMQELNLLLILLYRMAGFEAKPIVISTRSNGRLSLEYPNTTEFNHVLCQLRLNDKTYILDASDKYLGFGQFLEENYNGYGILLGDEWQKIKLDPDSIFQKETILYNLKKGSDFIWNSTIEYKTSEAKAYHLRKSTQLDKNEIFKTISDELDIENPQFTSMDSLQLFDSPLLIKMKFQETMSADSLIYISPFQHSLTRENPFKSKERISPIEFPYINEELYVAMIEIPDGYKVVSMPAPRIYQLDPDQSVTVEIKCVADSNKITARSKIKFKRTFFEPDEYEALQKTYDYVVNQHADVIVLSKF